jgi:hypothetical protein
MKYKVNNEVFDTVEEAYQYCEENELSLEDVEEIEGENLEKLTQEKKEETISEIEEDTPSDVGSSSEREVDARGAIEMYDHLDDATKAQVLSVSLGLETGSDKIFKRPMSTKEALENYVSRFKELVEEGSCPVCRVNYSQLASSKQMDIGTADENKSVCIQEHLSQAHPAVWSIISSEFTHEKEIGDTALPSGKLMPHQTGSPNPEQCNLENLSREELAEMLSKNPESLKQFYKRAFLKMQGKE